MFMGQENARNIHIYVSTIDHLPRALSEQNTNVIVTVQGAPVVFMGKENARNIHTYVSTIDTAHGRDRRALEIM